MMNHRRYFASSTLALALFFTLPLALHAQHEGHGAAANPTPAEKPETGNESEDIQTPKDEHAGHAMPESKVEGRKAIMVNDVQKQLIGVRTTVAAEAALEREIGLYGRIEFDETMKFDINAKTGGYIGELAVDKTGTFVRKGDLLFTLYSPELFQAQEELIQAVQTQKKLGTSWGTLITAARQRLKLWDVTDQQIDEIVRTGKTEKYLRIEAPVSGIVVHKNAVEERSIKQGETVYQIICLDHVWLEADAYEQDLAFIKTKQNARVSLPYFPGSDFEAAVDFIYPFLEAKTRTTRIRFMLDNPDSKLRPGMYASVNMISELEPQVVVPRSAVLDTGKRQIVYVEQGKGIFVPTLVRKGFTAGDQVQILEGITPGTVVVESGNFLLDSESQLKATSGGGGHQH